MPIALHIIAIVEGNFAPIRAVLAQNLCGYEQYVDLQMPADAGERRRFSRVARCNCLMSDEPVRPD